MYYVRRLIPLPVPSHPHAPLEWVLSSEINPVLQSMPGVRRQMKKWPFWCWIGIMGDCIVPVQQCIEDRFGKKTSDGRSGYSVFFMPNFSCLNSLCLNFMPNVDWSLLLKLSSLQPFTISPSIPSIGHSPWAWNCSITFISCRMPTSVGRGQRRVPEEFHG